MSARIFSLLFLLLSASAQAELYKWVGADGKINYTDTPPPANAKVLATTALSVANKNVALPYELAQAVKHMPVTLYSADKHPGCAEARFFLKNNGIPFTEKMISSNDDIDKLEQLSGGTQLPVLFIGKNKLLGFSAGEWRTSLTRAGYPESNVLPANYRFPEPQPLTSVTIAPKPIVTPPSDKPKSPEAPARDPNGFRF